MPLRKSSRRSSAAASAAATPPASAREASRRIERQSVRKSYIDLETTADISVASRSAASSPRLERSPGSEALGDLATRLERSIGSEAGLLKENAALERENARLTQLVATLNAQNRGR